MIKIGRRVGWGFCTNGKGKCDLEDWSYNVTVGKRRLMATVYREYHYGYRLINFYDGKKDEMVRIPKGIKENVRKRLVKIIKGDVKRNK